jgi:putative restriction endonuclease
MTEEHSLPALEAAHIKPFALDGPHTESNGILLRPDIHRLFDAGYITVTPDYRVLVSDGLKEHFSNGRSYYPFTNQPLAVLPKSVEDFPDRDLLRWHNEVRFRR